jgi:plasmid stabilization system protein ParE
MMPKLIIADDAIDDIIRASVWYNQQRLGFGEEFSLAVDRKFEPILRNPELFELFHGEVRRAAVGRFPYDILFRSSDDCVTIVCVVHHSRDEHVWRSRLSRTD